MLTGIIHADPYFSLQVPLPLSQAIGGNRWLEGSVPVASALARRFS